MSRPPAQDVSPLSAIREFLQLESASGILLVIAGLIAMIAANSPLSVWYDALLQVPFKIQLAEFQLDKPLLIWINDLLMAVFFLLIGLEIKREVVMGELSDRAKIALPAIAAAGGMIVPQQSTPRSTGTTPSACAAGPSPRPPTSPSRSACCRSSASAFQSGSRSS